MTEYFAFSLHKKTALHKQDGKILSFKDYFCGFSANLSFKMQDFSLLNRPTDF